MFSDFLPQPYTKASPDIARKPIPEAPASASPSKLESLTAVEAGAEAEGKANARTLIGKQGVEWDEDLFVVLIDSYGKARIVQESVKNFRA